VLVLELLVMFSRVYLGMHSINQVLFGLMIGCFSMVVYYLFVEQYLYVLSLKYLAEGKKSSNFVWMSLVFGAICLYECLITYLADFNPPNNPTDPWIMRINSI
jgi:phosphotransferase system  glucose/maltose/N-acetylglucosamine-specific IIC component